MFVSLVMVPAVVISKLGGIGASIDALENINPALFNAFMDASTNEALTIVGIISLMSWGLGYFGQPHIIVRFMAIRSVKDIPTARNIGMSWMIVSIIGALMTGLFGLAYVTGNGNQIDPETVFIYLSQILFHPLIGGFLLAAILAAIMSTISSQLLVSSSSLTEDFYKAFLRKDASEKELVFVGRMSVLAVSLVAIWLAWNPENTILSLVSNAWAGFGAAFGPVVILSLFWKRMNRHGALAGMLAGAVTVLFWIYGPTFGGEQLSAYVYEIVPGFILSTLAIIIFSKVTAEPEKELQDKFEEMESVIDDYYHGDKKG